MAKLSARGRTELARVAKTVTDEDGTERTTKHVLMSDRKVLTWRGWHSVVGKSNTGWKVRGTLKAGITTEQWIALREAQGYQVVKR